MRAFALPAPVVLCFFLVGPFSHSPRVPDILPTSFCAPGVVRWFQLCAFHLSFVFLFRRIPSSFFPSWTTFFPIPPLSSVASLLVLRISFCGPSPSPFPSLFSHRTGSKKRPSPPPLEVHFVAGEPLHRALFPLFSPPLTPL